MTNPPENAPERARVLIVDDSPSALRFLQAVLEGEDYDVVTANDGEEGLARVRQYRPDLVVTDNVMPRLDGLGLLRSLRGHASTRHIPVIVLTGEDPELANIRPGDLQPDAFVRKSADMAPLIGEVSRLLNQG
jgi:adenylate cyclase